MNESSDFEFRTARANDHQWIVRVVDEWWGRPVAHAIPRLFLDHFHLTSSVIEQNQQTVGFLIGFMSASELDQAYIHFVGIQPNCRRFGLAAQLYQRFFQQAILAKRTKVKAITAATNTKSILFHQKMGFAVSTPIAGYDHPDKNHVVFTRAIAQ